MGLFFADFKIITAEGRYVAVKVKRRQRVVMICRGKTPLVLHLKPGQHSIDADRLGRDTAYPVAVGVVPEEHTRSFEMMTVPDVESIIAQAESARAPLKPQPLH